MSVTVYKALKHRILAGKKIYHNNTWKTLPDNAKMWLNGAWHKIGSGAAENAVSIPADPEQSVTHENGIEPSAGTIWYITPNGAGNMDGTSWANAASGSMIHVILLSASSGDSVYFSEGDYTTDRIISLPAGVNFYGGFDADTPTWATRNGFTKQTVFTKSGSSSFSWMSGNNAVSGQKIDGFVIKNYSGTISGSNATLRNSIVNLGTASLQTAIHCVFISVLASVIQADYCNFFYGNTGVTTADHVNVYGTEASKPTVRISGAQYCTAVNCTSTSGSNSYIFGDNAANCTAVNCTSTGTGNNSRSYIFGDNATSCTAVNCTSTGTGNNSRSYIFGDNATSCTAVNCTSTSTGTSGNNSNSYIFGDNATNCTAVNCTSTGTSPSSGYYYSHIFGDNATSCTAVNCTSTSTGTSPGVSYYYSYIFGDNAANCTAVNCTTTSTSTGTSPVNNSNSYIFYDNAANCTAVNCSAEKSGSGGSNSVAIFHASSTGRVANCLSWNNIGTEYSDFSKSMTCAGSNHNTNLALVLGTDNSIARFTNTGYSPAQGVQDVGDCPNPITDPTGYAAYLAAFGDWHPLSNSFLVGRGTADSNVTTDADGVTRPDPPTIGAYEPVPVNA